MGESAGGFSVFSNLASPTAAGLFQGAIAESGGYFHYQDYYNVGIDASVVPLATAESANTPWVPAGTTLAANIGCDSITFATLPEQSRCLRAKDAPTVLGSFPAFGLLFPIVDGAVLTQTPAAAFAAGSFNHVPVMAGTTHDESRLNILLEYDYGVGALQDVDYAAAVNAFIYPPNPALVDLLVNTEYPLTNYTNPVSPNQSAPLALGALETDVQFVCTTRNAEGLLAPQVPTYVYEFNDATAPLWFTPPFFFPPISFPMGDAHFIDVQYLFLNQGLGLGGDEQTLSNTMIGYWTQFAKTGDPNSTGAPVWPQYSVGGSLESLIAPTPTTETDASFDADHKCSSFWNTF